jgi:midasin (ATPase involved in ribosome maturation)
MVADIVPIRKDTPMTKKFNPNAVSEHDYAQVPAKDKNYVAFGEFKMIEKIISSGKFFPVFISGHSGNGKTFMVEQACSKAKRAMIRVQMSRETDEDDLIGGFRLIEGETKFMKGPVLRAMELGALLLIDEADRADPGKAMCLQGILEGKPYYMKKTGEIVQAAHGFNVIVTANTKLLCRRWRTGSRKIASQWRVSVTTLR